MTTGPCWLKQAAGLGPNGNLKKCSFDNIYPPQLQQKALSKWHKHGY